MSTDWPPFRRIVYVERLFFVIKVKIIAMSLFPRNIDEIFGHLKMVPKQGVPIVTISKHHNQAERLTFLFVYCSNCRFV